MNNKTRNQIAARIKSLRLDAELSQSALAEAAGIDRKTINRIENGHFSPSMDTFFRICHVLSVRPSEIVDGVKV